jgi:hypothetical protein
MVFLLFLSLVACSALAADPRNDPGLHGQIHALAKKHKLDENRKAVLKTDDGHYHAFSPAHLGHIRSAKDLEKGPVYAGRLETSGGTKLPKGTHHVAVYRDKDGTLKAFAAREGGKTPRPASTVKMGLVKGKDKPRPNQIRQGSLILELFIFFGFDLFGDPLWGEIIIIFP